MVYGLTEVGRESTQNREQIESEIFINTGLPIPTTYRLQKFKSLSNCSPNKELQNASQPNPCNGVSLGTRRKLPTPLTTENQPATSATLFVRTHLDDGLSIDEATLKLVKELRTYLVTALALHLPKDTLAGIVL